MFNQEHVGIFGETYRGVPNPHVGHVHPYPTRYHGPIWTQPQAGYPYRPATYVQPPFTGADEQDKGPGWAGLLVFATVMTAMWFLIPSRRSHYPYRHNSCSRMRPNALPAYELERIGSLMHHWHGGMWDPIYMVGSYFVEGKRYPDVERVENALNEIERLKRLPLKRSSKRELSTIAAGLRRYLAGERKGTR